MLAFQPSAVRMDRAKNFAPRTIGMERDFTHLRAARPAGFAWMAQDLHPEGAMGDATASLGGKGRGFGGLRRARLHRSVARCRSLRARCDLTRASGGSTRLFLMPPEALSRSARRPRRPRNSPRYDRCDCSPSLHRGFARPRCPRALQGASARRRAPRRGLGRRQQTLAEPIPVAAGATAIEPRWRTRDPPTEDHGVADRPVRHAGHQKTDRRRSDGVRNERRSRRSVSNTACSSASSASTSAGSAGRITKSPRGSAPLRLTRLSTDRSRSRSASCCRPQEGPQIGRLPGLELHVDGGAEAAACARSGPRRCA